MPEVKLDVTDAAELAEMLQFPSGWLARDPARSAPPWNNSLATPATASRTCAPVCGGSSSCSAAATAGRSSAGDRNGSSAPADCYLAEGTTVSCCLHRRRSRCTGSRRSSRASQGPPCLLVARITWS